MTWYKNKPIRFECQTDCHKCCLTGRGEYASVTYHHTDMNKLSEENKKQLIWVGRANLDKPGYWEQPTSENAQCMFLVDVPFGGGPMMCGIHSVKPKPCAAYPFWPSVIESEESWNKEAEFCPGIGTGPIIPTDEIKKKLDSVNDYPNLRRS